MNDNLNTPAIAAAIKLRATDLLVREAEDRASIEATRAALFIGGCINSITPADALVLLVALQRAFDSNHQPLPGLDALVAAAGERYRSFNARTELYAPFGLPGFPLSPAEARKLEHEGDAG